MRPPVKARQKRCPLWSEVTHLRPFVKRDYRHEFSLCLTLFTYNRRGDEFRLVGESSLFGKQVQGEPFGCLCVKQRHNCPYLRYRGISL